MTRKSSPRAQPVRLRMLEKLKKQQAQEATASAPEKDPPYLVALLAEVMADYPELTRDEAREIIKAFT